MTKRFIDEFAATLFEHGLEGYSGTRGNQVPTNLGGCKIWADPYKSPNTGISFNNPHFEKVLKELPITLYTLSRVQLDEKGQPVPVPGNGKGHNRICSSLMVYPHIDDNPQTAVDIRNRILEVMRGYPLADRVEIASRINAEGIKILETYNHRDWSNQFVPLKLHSCILLAIPSGPAGGTQFWSLKPGSRTKTRTGMSSSTTATDVGDLPMF